MDDGSLGGNTPAESAPTAFVAAPAVEPRADRPRRSRAMRVVRITAALIVAGGMLTSPWWARETVVKLDYFHVRQVEFEGIRFARARELVALLRVDTLQSIWQQVPPLESRLAQHPLVAQVSIERRLPGTLVAHVVERQPVALATLRGMLRPVDATGHFLPIDPARTPLDVPVAEADSALLTLLDGLRQDAPATYARITQARTAGAGEFRLWLGDLIVRTNADVTAARFRDILPVEADLARNGIRPTELDLRFQGQVIARHS